MIARCLASGDDGAEFKGMDEALDAFEQRAGVFHLTDHHHDIHHVELCVCFSCWSVEGDIDLHAQLPAEYPCISTPKSGTGSCSQLHL